MLETAVALAIFAACAPIVIEAFASMVLTEFQTREKVRAASYAEWWLNRASVEALDSMPRFMPSASFDWHVENGENGLVRVTLTASTRAGSVTLCRALAPQRR
ncbi:MAG: hypothetical protein LBR38_09480 [Synergistaceae bacterium]|jgi:hypothetical protein|nr:hypothetical protein [Synergistaceae bacterium]